MKIKKSDYMTMEVLAERLGCKPDALAIVEAIERLKKRVKKLRQKLKANG